jgi:SnoaL-like domain
MLDHATLSAIEEIRQLKARYFHCTDIKDWKGLGETFAEDVQFDMRDSFKAVDPVSGAARVYGRPELLLGVDTSTWNMCGRDEIVANGARQFADVCTVHHGCNPQIVIRSEEEADGIWAMTDLLRFPSGSPIQEIRGFGHYHERYRRIGGHWLIQTETLIRLRIDVS